MGSEVGAELTDVAVGKPARELEDVANAGAAESVESLVVVAGDCQVLVMAGEGQEDLFLDVVGVLILVDDDVGDVHRDVVPYVGFLEEFPCRALQVGEVGEAMALESLPVCDVALADGGMDWVWGLDEVVGPDQLVGDAVEAVAQGTHHGVGRLPAAQEKGALAPGCDVVKPVVDEDGLGEVVKDLVVGRPAGVAAVLA